MRLCQQMLAPPQSLHLLLMQLCGQMLAPPQSLHWLLRRRCAQTLTPPQSFHENGIAALSGDCSLVVRINSRLFDGLGPTGTETKKRESQCLTASCCPISLSLSRVVQRPARTLPRTSPSLSHLCQPIEI